MSEVLYPYYERELLFIRQLAQEFARQYPAAAGRLMLEPNRSVDPHVERLIESFALLSARIHHKIDDEFPELTDALLNILYPHYLAPVPSCAILAFVPDPDRAPLTDGFLLPRHSALHTHPVRNLPCKFRTAYPVTLWPVRVVDAHFHPPPFPAGLRPPRGTAAALRIELECQGGLKFADLSLDTLRFYLNGQGAMVGALYELLFNSALQVTLQAPAQGTTPGPAGRREGPPSVTLDPEACLHPVGFAEDEGLLPYPRQSFLGYRLLTEFFTFPEKFTFVDLSGLRHLRRPGFGDRAEVVIYFRETVESVEQGVDAQTFRLGCTPAVNLFEQTAEPIALTHTRYEYKVVPDVAHPGGMEIYSVDSVTGADPTRGHTEYEPFYSFRHGMHDGQQTFWYATRKRATQENDHGTDVYLSLVDLGFRPTLPDEAALVVRTTCTNRDLPLLLQRAGEQLHLELEAAAPLARVQCVRTPTTPLRPPQRRGAYWRLISHLSLNHLSLGDVARGREALQELLRLYDVSVAESAHHLASVNRQLIEGITEVSSRRVVGRVAPTGAGPTAPAGGFCRGVEVSVEFDEEKYVGTGLYLFASVLERFLGLYASVNSFSQLVARVRQREGLLKRWPPRAGDQPLL
jgi:type VI secretion system protein ImpG